MSSRKALDSWRSVAHSSFDADGFAQGAWSEARRRTASGGFAS